MTEVASRSSGGMAGAALVVGGVLYGLFHASSFVDAGLSDDFWFIGLAVHGALLVAIGVGLVAARRHFGLDGWEATVWTVATGLAILGMTIGHPLWSLALFGLAVVVATRLESQPVAILLAVGAAGWLYLFVTGIRVGDENGPPLTDGDVMLGLISLALMAAGLVGLGVLALRTRLPAEPATV